MPARLGAGVSVKMLDFYRCDRGYDRLESLRIIVLRCIIRACCDLGCEDVEYKYAGVELTPNIFRELLIQFFDGKQFRRQDAVVEITRYHVEHGGLLEKAEYNSTFKKAAEYLKEEGLENVVVGVWRLCYKESAAEVVSPVKQTDVISYRADKEIGFGKSSVYVYYYDSYKELAELKGNKSWECKVGRTDVDPISRILGQAGTCYPEFPHVALIIYCEDSSLLEKVIHSVLKFKNRWLENAPGKEWFITSPEEIEDIFVSITR